uniref:Saposin A-type domain-containing protein n=1 Tax=Ciona savignyi TaxID=51511 RepID=H2YDR8_CIOSA
MLRMCVGYLLLFLYMADAQRQGCNVAPTFWCDDVTIATQCGVLPACADRLFPQFAAQASTVEVGVFFESLCPDSIKFITTQLFPTWLKLKATGIMNITIFPYGKAKMQQDGSTWNFTCQHGPRECRGNLIENCLMNATHNITERYLPVVQCMESAKDPIQAAEPCIVSAGLNWTSIDICASGADGATLMHRVGVATEALNPTLNWVPWITINGMHTDHIQSMAVDDLHTLVCDTYKGTKPAECVHTKLGIAYRHKRIKPSKKIY